MTGDHADYRLHGQVQFGEYAQVHESHDNTMTTRTTGAIVLRPTGNAQGGYYFMSLASDRDPRTQHVRTRTYVLTGRRIKTPPPNKTSPTGIHTVRVCLLLSAELQIVPYGLELCTMALFSIYSYSSKQPVKELPNGLRAATSAELEDGLELRLLTTNGITTGGTVA